jgi:hypothetical protein
MGFAATAPNCRLATSAETCRLHPVEEAREGVRVREDDPEFWQVDKPIKKAMLANQHNTAETFVNFSAIQGMLIA